VIEERGFAGDDGRMVLRQVVTAVPGFRRHLVAVPSTSLSHPPVSARIVE
jgi:hypothetical protein